MSITQSFWSKILSCIYSILLYLILTNNLAEISQNFYWIRMCKGYNFDGFKDYKNFSWSTYLIRIVFFSSWFLKRGTQLLDCTCMSIMHCLPHNISRLSRNNYSLTRVYVWKAWNLRIIWGKDLNYEIEIWERVKLRWKEYNTL